MRYRQTRRKYLITLGATSVFGLAGCSQADFDQQATTEVSTSDLSGANFRFEYSGTDREVTIRYGGGASILAGDLQVRSSTGTQVQWSQLGSTVADTDELIASGATAVLGEDILNWDEPVTREETIRLVHVGGNSPATLGRFTPPESSTLTSTVPPTETVTTEPTETVTTESTETPTPDPTETPTPEPDTTAPSITAFSLSNPSGQLLRTSFESDEQLATIRISISGPESAVLSTDDFTESAENGIYSHEATYQASSNGDYTATLDSAIDESGNDGAEGDEYRVSVSVTESNTSGLDSGETLSLDFEDSSLSNWTVEDDRWGWTDESGYNSNASTTVDTSSDISLMASAAPDELNGGQQLSELRFYWHESSASFGGGIELRNSNDGFELCVGTDNPQWMVVTDPENGAYDYVDGGENYENWIEARVIFDWDNGSAEVEFTDTQTGASNSSSFTLSEGTDISSINIYGFTSLRLDNGDGLVTGSCAMNWDQIELTG